MLPEKEQNVGSERPRLEVLKGGGQSSHKPTDDELRDRFMERNPGQAHGQGEWRRYSGGVYGKVSEIIVKRAVAEVIEEAKTEGIRPTAALLSSVTELARVKVAVPDEEWDSDPDVLVCRNGVLHIPTEQLRPHGAEYHATSAVPYDYDRDASANYWRLFLRTTVPDAEEFLQEFAGYALTTDTSHEVALWLCGPPGSGKSTLLEGLQAMLGARAGVLGLADLERSRFALANLPGKTLVTATEQPSGFLSVTHILNAIISGEPLEVERKYRDAYTVVPRAKIAWAMNELPRVGDASSGLFRRVKVVQFPGLDERQRDPQIKEKIKREGAGILAWALKGLYRLRKRGHFEVLESVENATAYFRSANDVPALFVEDRCIVDSRERVQSAKLYQAYRDWCLDNGHRPESSTRLASDWKRLGFEKTPKSHGVNYWRGLRPKMPGEE